ncbi:polymer-forming cytoskeletal protein [Massilia sp. MB5]|uniref:polymer-forming cytoskeletal protein n=1 Tax=Massilia sp. MB5 TaxID=2919578 RepID=UPI001F0E06F9|nr:polymer-forming cytoskeletal protein [Massilia sp. MB5]UMR29092.1 polymer-forming cytoskeletal protein [Massilia sp. MB5]
MDSRLSSLLPKFAAVPLAFLLYMASSPAMADTYNLPADLKKSPFNCSGSGQDYNCGSIDLDKDAVLVLNGPIRLQVSGNFSTDKNLSSVNNGYSFDISVGGSVDLKKDVDVTMNLTVGGSVDIAKDARFTGNITAGGNATFAKDSIYDGNVTVGGFLSVDKNTYITGTCRAGATNFSGCGAKPPVSALHHVRISHNGTALTCTPAAITVYACTGTDSSNTCTAYTGGVSGNVKTSGGASVPFTIPSSSSSTSVGLAVTTAGTVTLSADGYTSSNGYTCWNGASASCSLDFQDAAFLISVADHIAGTTQTAKIEAVKKSDTSSRCTPGFTGTRAVNLGCSYSNPASGSVQLSIGGSKISCNAPATAITLSFDSNGVAEPSLSYEDVGALTLNASIASPTMTGSDGFVVAPASFSIAPNESNPHKAGSPFTADVTALNALGKATPNFGKENPAAQVRVGFNKCTPTANLGAASGVVATGLVQSFTNGKGQAANISWSEVGTGDLTAYLDSNPGSASAPLPYLSSAIKPAGSTATANSSCTQSFVPHHFDVTHASTRLFWYSGQTISKIKVTAKAYANPLSAATTTQNYMLGAAANAKVDLTAFSDGPPAAAVPSATGTLNTASIAGSAFQSVNKGEAELTPVFTFAQIKTPPHIARARDRGDHRYIRQWERGCHCHPQRSLTLFQRLWSQARRRQLGTPR